MVAFATPPFYANSDDQSLLNDVLVASITNRSCYLWSTAFFEVRYGGSRSLGKGDYREAEKVARKASVGSLACSQ